MAVRATKILFGQRYFRCGECRVWRFQSAFTPDPKKKYGVGSTCRRCKGIYTKRHPRKLGETISQMKEVVRS